MGKKKKRRNVPPGPPPPDPRRIALASHIDRELAKREDEETSHKNTLRPLKRVNSNPMIYEFVPMARNMFADSKSVDFGFDGSVEIPNQAIYLEEHPDDEDFDKEPPDDFPSTMSLGYMYSTDIEDDELEKLDNMESNDEDFWRFLRARIGKEKFETLQESPQYQTLLTMPEPTEEEVPAAEDDNEDDAEDGGWLSFPTSLFGSWWTRTDEEKVDEIIDPIEDLAASEKVRTRTESVVDPPDTLTTADTLKGQNSTDSFEGKGTKRRSRTAKERWLLYRSRMWHKSHRSKEHEKPEEVPVSNATFNDARNEFLDDEIHLVASDIKDESEKASGRKKCLILLLILLVVVMACVAGTVIAAYLGVYVPIISDTLFPLGKTNSSMADTTVSSYDTLKVTSSPAISETTVFQTVIESLSEIEAIPGTSPAQYARQFPGELGIITGDLIELNGESFDAMNFESVEPPTEEFSNAVGIAIYDTFKFLGFEVGQVTLSTGKFGSGFGTLLTVFIFVFGRPDANVGLMKWYGYTKNDSYTDSTPFTRRLTTLIPRVMNERRGTLMQRFYYTVSNNFMDDAKPFMDATDVQRAPYRVPNEWGNCDGVSVCELGPV